MAINKVNLTFTSLRRAVRLYGGPKIPGLWQYSRETAGRDSRFDQYHLYGILPPKHPLIGHRLPAKDLTPAQVRDIVRQAVRLNEADPMLKNPFFRRNGMVPLNPFAADDEDYPLGDLFSLKTRRNVPFTIVVDRASLALPQPFSGPGQEENQAVLERWKRTPEKEKEKLLRAFFDKLNENLKYLSGGRFSLRLTEIQFADQGPKLRQPTGGFVMHLLNPDLSGEDNVEHPIGQYFGNGHFNVGIVAGLFHREKRIIYTSVAIHEMLHGIFGLGHNDGITDETGKKTVFDWTYSTRIKLSSFEAEFLSWPNQKTVSTIVDAALAA